MANDSVLNVLLIGGNIETRIVFKNALSKLDKQCSVGDYFCLDKAVGTYDNLKTAKPDIIFVDVRKSTEDFCSDVRKIKDCDSLKDSSLIVFDSDSKLRNTNGIFSEGANVFINQPYDFPRLKKVIGAIISDNSFKKTTGHIIA